MIKIVLALLALLIADGNDEIEILLYRLLNSRIILIAVFGMQIETSSSGKSEHVPGYKISIRIRRTEYGNNDIGLANAISLHETLIS